MTEHNNNMLSEGDDEAFVSALTIIESSLTPTPASPASAGTSAPSNPASAPGPAVDASAASPKRDINVAAPGSAVGEADKAHTSVAPLVSMEQPGPAPAASSAATGEAATSESLSLSVAPLASSATASSPLRHDIPAPSANEVVSCHAGSAPRSAPQPASAPSVSAATPAAEAASPSLNGALGGDAAGAFSVSTPSVTQPTGQSDGWLLRPLHFARRVTQNLVPRSSPYYRVDAPGLLLSDTVLPMYERPLTLVWLDDLDAKEARAQNQCLPSHCRGSPLLPHFLFSSYGDGDCVPRSIMLAEYRGATEGYNSHPTTAGTDDHIADIMKIRCLRRDAFTGLALKQRDDIDYQIGHIKSAAELEKELIASFRQRFVPSIKA